jgi:integrase
VLLIRNFCRLARHYGCQVVPELNVKVPKSQRSRRTQTFTSDEFHDLVDALEDFIAPDTEDGTYLRDWGLGAAKARQVVPKVVNQDLERSRREMLRFFVLVAAASGCRPHELAGEEDGSLRWRDVEFKDVLVKVSLSQREPTPKTVAILKVRELTKTGERSVPMVGGKYLK